MESPGNGEREGGSSEIKWNSLSTSIPGEEDRDIMSLLFGSTPFPDGSETMDFTSFLWNDQDVENNFNDRSQTSTDSHLPPPHDAHHNAHNDIESYYLNDPSAGVAMNNGGPVEMNFFVGEDKTGRDQALLPQRKPTPKRLPEIDKNTSSTKKKKKPRIDEQVTKTNGKRKKSDSQVCKSLSGLSNEDDSSMMLDIDEGSSKSKNKAGPGSAVADPQSIYAKKRRERINERLKILQNLVPNGTKVDISTMLEEAVEYVKFLKLQIKVLSSDDMWMYAPIAYNGMDSGLDLKRSPPQQKSK